MLRVGAVKYGADGSASERTMRMSTPYEGTDDYGILTMNQDSTISVIDPMVDVAGMTNLFSVIILQSPAQDWVMAPQQSRLFATLPDLDKVAVVDLNAFLVEDTVDLPGKPQRIALAPDGGSVWVTLGDDGKWIALDPTMNRPMGWAPRAATRKVVPLRPVARPLPTRSARDG